MANNGIKVYMTPFHPGDFVRTECHVGFQSVCYLIVSFASHYSGAAFSVHSCSSKGSVICCKRSDYRTK